MNQLSLKDDTATTGKLSKPLLAVEELIKQAEELFANALNNDTEALIKKFDVKLFTLFNSGIPLIDIAPMVSCFTTDAEILVLTARKLNAHTLLKLLQATYIWRDAVQFHWFKVLSYENFWYDQDLWKNYDPFPMDWGEHLWVICEQDNGALALMIQREIPLGSDLETFNEKLLEPCIIYDAVRVFEATRLRLIQTEKHLELMAIHSSVKLLNLYQIHTELPHLHLERFPFPKQLPTNIKEFGFLLKHGLEFFPIKQSMEKLCREGNLSALEYLYDLDQRLIPEKQELVLAAENGWMNVLKWSFKFWYFDRSAYEDIVFKLAICCHLEILDWLTENNHLELGWSIISKIIEAGALVALQWIYKKQPTKHTLQLWSDFAAYNCHLPILEWIHKELGILPVANCLERATIELLEWIQSKDPTLISAALIRHGTKNFGLLQWTFENFAHLRPIFERERDKLAKNVHSMDMMLWLYENLQIQPQSIKWAYETGDLEAIQWFEENFQDYHTDVYSSSAIKMGHLHVIKWVYETFPAPQNIPYDLKTAIEVGNLEIANYLLSISNPHIEPRNFSIENVCRAGRLDVLEWIHTHKYDMNVFSDLELIISMGHLHILKWLHVTYPDFLPDSSKWKNLVKNGHLEAYKWLLEKYPKERQPKELHEDIQQAFNDGHLEIVKVIAGKDPSAVLMIDALCHTKSNFHVWQWVIAKQHAIICEQRPLDTGCWTINAAL